MTRIFMVTKCRKSSNATLVLVESNDGKRRTTRRLTLQLAPMCAYMVRVSTAKLDT